MEFHVGSYNGRLSFLSLSRSPPGSPLPKAAGSQAAGHGEGRGATRFLAANVTNHRASRRHENLHALHAVAKQTRDKVPSTSGRPFAQAGARKIAVSGIESPQAINPVFVLQRLAV